MSNVSFFVCLIFFIIWFCNDKAYQKTRFNIYLRNSNDYDSSHFHLRSFYFLKTPKKKSKGIYSWLFSLLR